MGCPFLSAVQTLSAYARTTRMSSRNVGTVCGRVEEARAVLLGELQTDDDEGDGALHASSLSSIASTARRAARMATPKNRQDACATKQAGCLRYKAG